MQQATVNLLRRHGGPAVRADQRAHRRPAASTDTTAPTSTITSPAGGTASATAASRDDQRDRDGRGRRRRRRRRGLDRRRHDLAPGDGDHELELHLGGARQPEHHDQVPRGRRQRQPRDARLPGPRERRAAPARSGAAAPHPRVRDSGADCDRRWASSSGPTPPASSPGIRFYKSTTNTGTHVGNLWTAGGDQAGDRDLHQRESGAGGSRSPSPARWPSTPTPPTSRRTSRPRATPRPTRPTSTRRPRRSPYTSGWVDSPPLHALRNSNGTTNGLFVVSSTSAFPARAPTRPNYWVDVIFTTSTGLRRRPARRPA